MHVFFDIQVEMKATNKINTYGFKWRKFGELDFHKKIFNGIHKHDGLLPSTIKRYKRRNCE